MSKSQPWRSSFALRKGKTHMAPATLTPEPPLGSLLSTILKKDLLEESEEYVSSARITDCQYISSFNWRDSRKPSVYIPGKPPRWTPPSRTRVLTQDSGDHPRDRNGYHFPKHPFEATALSVLTTQPEPPKIDFDVVCASASLGYLASFCLGQEEFREFRMLVEVIGSTLHIIRRDKSPRELIPDIRGYGHTFPNAYTSWDSRTKGSTSHQRIIKYNLGGLNVLLRAEIDGYLPQSTPSSGESGRRTVSVDELVEGIAASSVSSKPPDAEASTLATEIAGSPVPQSSLFDLKTRSALRKNDDILTQQLPRLWRSQIPNLVLAFHKQGYFGDVTVHDVQHRVQEWEAENAESISLLISLLRRLVDVVMSSPGEKAEIRATVEGQIEVREQLPDAGEVFSPSVRERWEDWLEDARAMPRERGGLGEAPKSPADRDGSHAEFWEQDSSEDDRPLFVDSEYDDYTACSVEHCGYCGRCSY